MHVLSIDRFEQCSRKPDRTRWINGPRAQQQSTAPLWSPMAPIMSACAFSARTLYDGSIPLRRIAADMMSHFALRRHRPRKTRRFQFWRCGERPDAASPPVPAPELSLVLLAAGPWIPIGSNTPPRSERSSSSYFVLMSSLTFSRVHLQPFDFSRAGSRSNNIYMTSCSHSGLSVRFSPAQRPRFCSLIASTPCAISCKSRSHRLSCLRP